MINLFSRSDNRYVLPRPNKFVNSPSQIFGPLSECLRRQQQQSQLSLQAASVGGLEALFSLTSDLARLSWHIETRRTSWLDDQCTNPSPLRT